MLRQERPISVGWCLRPVLPALSCFGKSIKLYSMKDVKLFSPFVCLAVIALTASFARGQDGLRGALLETGSTRAALRTPLGRSTVAADFDNDHRPDGAILLDAGQLQGRPLFRIKLHVTAGQNHELTFQSDETALAIFAPDLDQDGTPDLVVEQVFTHRRLQVWLNDGHGNFRPARVEDFPPHTDAPCGLKAPLLQPCSLILSLPSRLGDDHAASIRQVLCTCSCSSRWRKRQGSEQTRFSSLGLHSPRPPPMYQPL